MIKQKTVFILGAGASEHYGFPMGSELTNTIIKHLPFIRYDQSEKLGTFLYECGFRPGETDILRENLLNAEYSSIDAFLEHAPHFRKLGTYLIAYFIMECEIRDRNKTKVFNSSDWYGYIWRKLTSHWNIADFTKNQVSFITFNYDRSLEKFLYNTLKHTYGRTEQETMQAFYSIPIIHVHGSLGDAVSLGKKSAPDYGAGFSTSTDLLASANNIKIIHDQMDDSVEFENAITLLKGAQKIIIIGLGYDETNMKRLNIKPNSYRMIHGSSFGLTDMECAEYNSKFGVQFHKSGRNKKALMFLRESLILN